MVTTTGGSIIKQMAHICIRTEDLGSTPAFYTDVLGLEKGFEFAEKRLCVETGSEMGGFHLY